MLSLQTERMLAQFLVSLAEGEHAVEATRQVLSSHPDFSPLSLFNHLDLSRLGVSANDLSEFLARTKSYSNYAEAASVVAAYDANSDNRLNYHEFMQLTLPSCNARLRDIAQVRRGCVSYEVEDALFRLVTREIQLQRDLDLQRKSIGGRYDFTVAEALNAIGGRYASFVDRYTIRGFLSKNGFAVRDDDLDALLRRLDRDGDERINFAELNDGLRAQNITYTPRYNPPPPKIRSPATRQSSPLRSSSPLRGSMLRSGSESNLRVSSPARPLSTSFTPARYRADISPTRVPFSYTPKASSYRRTMSPSRFTSSLRTSRSPVRASSPERSSASLHASRLSSPVRASAQLRASRQSSPVRASTSMRKSFESPVAARSTYSRSRNLQVRKMDYYDEADLVDMFKKQIDIEREIELAKQDLATRYDFNLYDIYDLFDDLGKGYLNQIDVKRQLNKFNIYPYRDEASLIIKHYSKGETRLNQAGFTDMFTSRDAYYANMLQKRGGERRRIFSYETETRIQRILSLHVEAEEMAESLRQRLARSRSFNTYDAFKDVDSDRNGYVTKEEFESLLRHHNVPITHKDLNALMDIYDKRRDGRVGYTDFAQEVSPKSPHKY